MYFVYSSCAKNGKQTVISDTFDHISGNDAGNLTNLVSNEGGDNKLLIGSKINWESALYEHPETQ